MLHHISIRGCHVLLRLAVKVPCLRVEMKKNGTRGDGDKQAGDRGEGGKLRNLSFSECQSKGKAFGSGQTCRGGGKISVVSSPVRRGRNGYL